MAFSPNVGTKLTIDSVVYRVAKHPAVPNMPYGQEGRQAVVYQLEAGEERRALKVFKPRFRLPILVSLAGRLEEFADLPGLQVCRRTVLSARRQETLLREHTDLTYAVLMPWIEGPTWTQVLLEKRALLAEESLALAQSLADALAAMEESGLAHCDLSGPNLMLPVLIPDLSPESGIGVTEGRGEGVALVDVEQMYGPDLRRPPVLVSGSPGYAHRSAPEGLWTADADRFAGAMLLGEMLGWCDEGVREGACGETYFDPREMQQQCERFRSLSGVLQQRWGAKVAGLFERAWRSDALSECATFGEWLVALPQRALARAELPNQDLEPGEVASQVQAREPPAGPQEALLADKDAELARLFDDGLAAYRAGRNAEGRELLGEVVREQPGYERNGTRADALLKELRGQKGPWLRLLRWGIPLVGAIIVILLLAGSTGKGPFRFLFATPTATAPPTATATPESRAADTITPTPTVTFTPTPTKDLAATARTAGTATAWAAATRTAQAPASATAAARATLSAAQTATEKAKTPTLLAAPVLDSPVDAATLSGEAITFGWRWDRELKADEHFDVRVWQEGREHWGIAWTEKPTYEARCLSSGTYSWSIVVLRQTGTKPDGSKLWEAVSQESEARTFTYSAPGGCGTSGKYPVGDINRDCVVDGTDLSILLDHWCPDCTCNDPRYYRPADVNGDCRISETDIAAIQAHFGEMCPP